MRQCFFSVPWLCDLEEEPCSTAMSNLISGAINANVAQLRASRILDDLGRLSVDELVSVRKPPIVITVVAPQATGPTAPEPQPVVATPVSLEEESRASHEVLALRDSLQQLADTNDRVMAQNIALLADLESAQRAVRELRADKDALAVQLKRALLAAPGPAA